MHSAMRIGLVIIAAIVVGCSSDKANILPPVVEHTPLPFDPTEQHELSRWWSNGTQMVRLDPQGSYVVYPGANRFHEPVERGRWRQTSYAVIWFEPYSALHRDPVRVQVSKIDGRLALQLPRGEPMPAIPAPPQVFEDRLLGQWQGRDGRLSLNDSLRYTFTATRASQSGPVVLSGHNGRWSLRAHEKEKTLVLQPDVPGMAPIELSVSETDGTISLASPTLNLSRPPQQASAGK
jgi:hypothetical protein